MATPFHPGERPPRHHRMVANPNELKGPTMTQRCPVCGSEATSLFLTRRQVPVHQNLIMPDMISARKGARGNLELRVCHSCGFSFNQAFDPHIRSYGEHYDNAQVFYPSV